MLQKLLIGAKQGDVNAVEEAVAEGADVDVCLSPHRSIPLAFQLRVVIYLPCRFAE